MGRADSKVCLNLIYVNAYVGCPQFLFYLRNATDSVS